jgi:predicted nucleic-acid-binding protein
LIGVDTNVLVRLFVVDDRRQSEIAGRFFTERSSSDPAFVSLVVVAELVWLLDDSFSFSHTEIVGVLGKLLDSPDFVLERREFVADAVLLAERKKIDIADFLISQVSLANGGRATVTFDVDASKRIPGMELLK